MPLNLRSDNGPQFQSDEFRDFCMTNGVTHGKVTAKWAQANGEVERQNSSLLKRLKIAQAERKSWRAELRRYITQYRSLEHPTTGRSPAELLYKQKIRGKLPDMCAEHRADQGMRDRDCESKAKSKVYTDMQRNARQSDLGAGDQALVKQDKTNKLSTTFGHDPYTVVSRNGNSLIVEAESGSQYSRNTSHVKRFVGREVENNSREVDDVSREVVDDHLPAPPDAVAASQSQQVYPDAVRPARPERRRQMPQRYNDFVC